MEFKSGEDAAPYQVLGDAGIAEALVVRFGAEPPHDSVPGRVGVRWLAKIGCEPATVASGQGIKDSWLLSADQRLYLKFEWEGRKGEPTAQFYMQACVHCWLGVFFFPFTILPVTLEAKPSSHLIYGLKVCHLIYFFRMQLFLFVQCCFDFR